MTRQEAIAWLDKAKCRNAGKPIANNTRVYERENGNIVIQLHQTDILTFTPNGDCVLNSDGWLTPTTKSRMNDYIPFGYYIIQNNGQWYINTEGKWQIEGSYVYFDGIILKADGTIDGKTYSKDIDKHINATKRKINKYIKGFMTALNNKQIPKPSGGDCWYCAMRTEDGKTLGKISDSDHIKHHLQEKYYVPSLLMNAIERFPVSIMAHNQLGYLLGYHDEDCTDFAPMHQIEKSLKRYIQEELKLASC